jgi:O-acetyl-ADP-ribose deacetylase (regulator of RNase III)
MQLPAFLRRKHAPFIDLAVGDITTARVDAIVNAAKSTLLGGGGVDGAIHAAGGPVILAECRAWRDTRYPDGLPVGQAVATTAGRLDARWVVHTVGPHYSIREDRSELLRSCYTESLRVADRLKAQTVAFPLISAGAYGWPVPSAIAEALHGISSGRYRHVRQVTLVLFDRDAYDIARRIYDAGRYWV